MKHFLSLFLIFYSSLSISQSTYLGRLDSILQYSPVEPGACICILKNDELIFEKCQGKALLEHEIDLTENSLFDIGTMGMHFTAAGILQLEKAGQLRLDDLVIDYLKDYPSYASGDITIQHLLNHTSGVRDYTALMMLSGKSFQDDLNQDDLYEIIRRQKGLTIVPGSGYRFSQSNYLLLAKIIEIVSDSDYKDFLQASFFSDFAMNATTVFDQKSKVILNRANAYETSSEGWIHDQRYNFTGYGDGRIYSSLEDLVKWIRNIKKSTIYSDLTRRGTLNDGSQMTYANGLEYGLMNGHSIFAHNGYFGAFSSMYIDFSDLDITILTLSNNGEISAPSLAYSVAQVVAPQQKVQSLKEEVSHTEVVLPKELLEEYVGKYFYKHYGYIREVYIENDTLIYKINEEVERKLIPISDNVFVAAGQARSTQFKFEGKNMFIIQQGQMRYDYIKYHEGSYSDDEHKALEGNYSSDELAVSYRLTVEEGSIKMYIGEKEISVFKPIYKGAFSSEHDGFLEIDDEGFYFNDYSIGRIRFFKN